MRAFSTVGIADVMTGAIAAWNLLSTRRVSGGTRVTDVLHRFLKEVFMLRQSAAVLSSAVFLTVSVPTFAQQTKGTNDPKVTVAAVRLDNGFRASKIIGSSVYNDQNQQVGTVSDLFLSKKDQVAMAVISVGSFLGIGGKLVSVPFDKLQIGDGTKVVMPGGSKEELNGMPNVVFGS
jgi:sporulation protein YlmC with PRC-barrel domain